MLEQRVAAQVGEIERANRLRRFLPAQVADMVTSDVGSGLLASRRAEITVLFSELRGFTAYSESAPPDHVMQVLRAYHAVAGPLIEQQQGTLERFPGDGIMVLFNAPLATPQPCLRAVCMAIALRDRFQPAIEPWQVVNSPLGIGIGIAHGTATVGTIGFEGRLDYSAISPVPKFAARLCDQAAPGEIPLFSLRLLHLSLRRNRTVPSLNNRIWKAQKKRVYAGCIGSHEAERPASFRL